MGADSPTKATDELIKRYRALKFPSGDIDDLIFGSVELRESENQPNINPKEPK